MVWHQFAIRLLLALILGALIGAERQWRQRMAGLRTNALVAGHGMYGSAITGALVVIGANVCLRPVFHVVAFQRF